LPQAYLDDEDARALNPAELFSEVGGQLFKKVFPFFQKAFKDV